MNIYNDDDTTKQDCDIVYGALTVGLAIAFPPMAIASLGMWFADRQHYPSRHDQDNNQTSQGRGDQSRY